MRCRRTFCIPEIAKSIDDYFEFRMRCGEACKEYGKSDHVHEYHDIPEEVIQKRFRKDERHLDPDAPLIREDFDKEDRFVAMQPRKISHQEIYDIIRKAAIAAGVRIVNKGHPFKRHKVMMTHGFRKLFKKRCRQAGVNMIILERLIGHTHGNPRDGVTNFMMTYDPVGWAEMLAEFEKAIPHLTITKDAMIQTKLEEAEAKLKNVPTIEQLHAELKAAEATKEAAENRQRQFEEQVLNHLEKYQKG